MCTSALRRTLSDIKPMVRWTPSSGLAVQLQGGAAVVALLLGLSSITVPWDTPLTSVVFYIVIPVLIAQA